MRGWKDGDASHTWLTVACSDLGHRPHVPNELVSLREGLENRALVMPVGCYWLFGKELKTKRWTEENWLVYK